MQREGDMGSQQKGEEVGLAGNQHKEEELGLEGRQKKGRNRKK